MASKPTYRSWKLVSRFRFFGLDLAKGATISVFDKNGTSIPLVCSEVSRCQTILHQAIAPPTSASVQKFLVFEQYDQIEFFFWAVETVDPLDVSKLTFDTEMHFLHRVLKALKYDNAQLEQEMEFCIRYGDEIKMTAFK